MSSGEKYIISSGGQTRTTASGGISVLMKNGDLMIQIRIMFTSLSWILNLGEISTNQWFHLSATWTKDGNLTGYINGTWQNSVSSESYISQNSIVVSNMHIGKPNNVDTSTYFGEVTLDEWYFWDNVLTTDHIKNLYEGYLRGTLLSCLCYMWLKFAAFRVQIFIHKIYKSNCDRLCPINKSMILFKI